MQSNSIKEQQLVLIENPAEEIYDDSNSKTASQYIRSQTKLEKLNDRNQQKLMLKTQNLKKVTAQKSFCAES